MTTKPAHDKRLLGLEVATLRRDAGKTQEQFAAELGYDKVTVSRIERGISSPHYSSMPAILDALGVEDEQRRTRLLSLARRARARRDKWSNYRHLMRGTYIYLEDDADHITEWAPYFFSGLTQTEGYLRTLFADGMPNADPTELDQRVRLRLKRQERLHDTERPLTFHQIVDEAVLHRNFGGPDIMYTQLDNLIKLIDSTNASIQVLPLLTDIRPLATGTAILLEFESASNTAEVMFEGSYSDSWAKPDDVPFYRKEFARIRTNALPLSASRNMLKEARSRWQKLANA